MKYLFYADAFTFGSNNNLEGESWLNPPELELKTYRGIPQCVDANGIIHFVDGPDVDKLYQIADVSALLLILLFETEISSSIPASRLQILDSHYRGSVMKAHDEYWYPGQICAVLSDQYNSWYRGRIVQVYPTKKRATVFLIDYGQDDDVT